jgi:hypothetical protein
MYGKEMMKYTVYLTKWAVSGIITTQCVNRPLSHTLNYSVNKDTYTDIALPYLCMCAPFRAKVGICENRLEIYGMRGN